MPARPPETILSIQYLRGLAALLVVVFHLQVPLLRFGLGAEWPQWLASGVDVFFVISGFVMLEITRRRPQPPLAFLAARLGRIAPLYWAVTGLMLAVALAAPSLLQNYRFAPAHALASLLFLPWPHPLTGMAEPVLIPGWTLNYEMAFYALFALGLAWPARRLAVLASGLLGAILAGMLLPDSAAIRFYGSPIILEFLAGALLAEAMGRGFVLPRGACAALIAAGAIGLAVEPWGWLGIAGRGAPLPAALALVAGAILWERAAPWPHWRWLHLLGDASYALYLVHTLALAALAIGWRLASLPASLPLLALAGLVVSVATGLATHLWIEIPLRRAVQRRRNGGAAAGPPPG